MERKKAQSSSTPPPQGNSLRWAVQLEGRWSAFEPGVQFVGRPEEEILYSINGKLYKAVFKSNSEGVQVNRKSGVTRTIRLMVLDELRNVSLMSQKQWVRSLARNPTKLKDAPPEIQGDIDAVLLAVSKAGSVLQYASATLQDDDKVVLQAVRNDGNALKSASRRLQDSEAVVQAAVGTAGAALRFASERIRDGDASVAIAMRTVPEALRFASPRLQALLASEEAQQAVQLLPVDALQGATCDLSDNDAVALAAVRHRGDVLVHVSERLRASKDLVLEAVLESSSRLQGAYTIKYALSPANQDPEVLAAVGLSSDHFSGDARQKERCIVLSERFSIARDASAWASLVLQEIRKQQCENADGVLNLFAVYAPNEFEKDFCAKGGYHGQFTSVECQCRGLHPDLCMPTSCGTSVDLLDAGGRPKSAAVCWRYSFRWHLDMAKQSGGAMVQLVEDQTLGAGQVIEEEMAEDVGIHIIRIHDGKGDYVRSSGSREFVNVDVPEHVRNLVDQLAEFVSHTAES